MIIQLYNTRARKSLEKATKEILMGQSIIFRKIQEISNLFYLSAGYIIEDNGEYITFHHYVHTLVLDIY